MAFPTAPKRMGRPPKDPTQPPQPPRVGTQRPGRPSKPKVDLPPKAPKELPLTRLNLQRMVGKWAKDTIDLDSRNPVNDLRRTLALAMAYMTMTNPDGTPADPETTRSYALVAVAAIRGLSDIRVEEISSDRQLAVHFGDRNGARNLMFAPAAYDSVVEPASGPEDDFIPADPEGGT